jgi:hypothetical protein
VNRPIVIKGSLYRKLIIAVHTNIPIDKVNRGFTFLTIMKKYISKNIGYVYARKYRARTFSPLNEKPNEVNIKIGITENIIRNTFLFSIKINSFREVNSREKVKK